MVMMCIKTAVLTHESMMILHHASVKLNKDEDVGEDCAENLQWTDNRAQEFSQSSDITASFLSSSLHTERLPQSATSPYQGHASLRDSTHAEDVEPFWLLHYGVTETFDLRQNEHIDERRLINDVQWSNVAGKIKTSFVMSFFYFFYFQTRRWSVCVTWPQPNFHPSNAV